MYLGRVLTRTRTRTPNPNPFHFIPICPIRPDCVRLGRHGSMVLTMLEQSRERLKVSCVCVRVRMVV